MPSSTDSGPRKLSDHRSDDFENRNQDRLKLNATAKEVAEVFACPVCDEAMLPPIMMCVNGHSICDACKKILDNCPLCRGAFGKMRNLLAEEFLNKCKFDCKYRVEGCKFVLFGLNMAAHQQNCPFRPIQCRQCRGKIDFGGFLEHLRVVEKITKHMASECHSEFYISVVDKEGGEESKLQWSQPWMQCYGKDFFGFLDPIPSTNMWFLWVGAHVVPKANKIFVCTIVVWNKKSRMELKFVGKVHAARTSPEEVFKSEQCLILSGAQVCSLMSTKDAGILMSVDRGYFGPRNQFGHFLGSHMEQYPRQKQVKDRDEIKKIAVGIETQNFPVP